MSNLFCYPYPVFFFKLTSQKDHGKYKTSTLQSPDRPDVDTTMSFSMLLCPNEYFSLLFLLYIIKTTKTSVLRMYTI